MSRKIMKKPEIVAPTEIKLAEHAEVIRALGRRVVADVIEIGRRLTDAKRIAGHGGWLPWLDREFGWSVATAENYIRVHELQTKFATVTNLDISMRGFYLLAAPSTPDEVIDEVIAESETGKKLNLDDVKRMIEEARVKEHDVHVKELKKLKKEVEKLQSDLAATSPEEIKKTIDDALEAAQAKIKNYELKIKNYEAKIKKYESNGSKDEPKNNGNEAAKPSRKYGTEIDYNYWIRKFLVTAFEEILPEFKKWLDNQIEKNTLLAIEKQGIIKALHDCSNEYHRVATELHDRGPEYVPGPNTGA
jgi:ribosomal protein S6